MSQAGSFNPGTGAPPIETITGNSGGPVGPSVTGNINLLGSDPITVVGNPGTNTLTISVASATTTQIGVVTLATNAETIAGVSTSKVVTPDDLKAKLGTQTANGVAYGTGTTAAVGWTAVGTDGQVLIAATGLPPAFASLTSSGGTILFTTGPNSLNLETASSGGMTWSEVVGASQVMVVNNGYISGNAGLVGFTLPAVAAVGDIVAIVGKGAGGWSLAQNAGQQIHMIGSSTTVGVLGSLASTVRYDCVELICITANTTWAVRSSMGNLTVV